MPRYYFIVQTPDERFDDDSGTTMRSRKEALAHAEKIANELASDCDCTGWPILIRDAAGRAIFTIPF